MPGPVPPRFLIIGAVSILVDVALWLNAGAILFTVPVWPYALAVTGIRVQSGIVFLITFESFLQQRPSDAP